MSEDRTSEFLSLARSLPQDRLQARPASISSNGGTVASSAAGRYGSNANGPNANPAYQELRQFHKTAADISRDIAATSAMLQELTQLVRSKSLFVDDSNRVNSLVLRIKANIENLNGRLDQAGATIQQQKYKLGRNSQAGQEADNVVGQLKEEFVQATAGFKKVLQQRTDGMKEKTGRQKDVYGASADTLEVVSLENKPPVYQRESSLNNSAFPTLDLTSGMSAGEPTSSASQLPRPHGIAGADQLSPELRMRRSASDIPMYSGSTSSYPYSGNSAPLTPLDIARMEQESGQDQMMQLIPDQDYLRQRADAMSTVESNIVELGTIFNKLAVMVSEHREMVQRVDDNVDEASTNINMSMAVLTDTLTSLRTNRALATKLFSIMVVFIIFFIIFFA